MKLKKIIKKCFWGIALVAMFGTQVNFAAEDGTNIMDDLVTELKQRQKYYIADADGLVKLSNLQAQGNVAPNEPSATLKARLDTAYKAYKEMEVSSTSESEMIEKTQAYEAALENARNYILKNRNGAYIYLIADIDVSGDGYGDTQPNHGRFKPIGGECIKGGVEDEIDVTKAFRSTFDGNGHKITVKLDKKMNEGINCIGLFGMVVGFGIIRNLGVEGSVTAIVNGDNNYGFAGGIAACSDTVDDALSATLIENCYNNCNITAESEYPFVGGISGGYSGTIRNCHSTGNIKARGYGVYAGGVAAHMYRSSIENCYNAGNITTESSAIAYVGGVVTLSNLIKNCFNIGDISVNGGYSYMLGGITGSSENCCNCYNAGALSVNGDSEGCFLGGICGSSKNCCNCYNVGALSVNGGSEECFLGGICGNSEDGCTIDNCYCHKDVGAKLVGDSSKLSDPSKNITVKNCGFKSIQQIIGGNLASELNSANNSTFIHVNDCLPPLSWQTEDTYVRVNDKLGKVLCGLGGEDVWRHNKVKNIFEHTLKPDIGYKVADVKEGADGTKYGSFKVA